MREIIFRGKRIDNGEWVDGYLISNNMIGLINEPCYCPDSIGCGVEDRGCVDRYEGAEYGYNIASEDIFQGIFTVIPETVGQYTGLEDDSNMPIYEGDLIKDLGTGYIGKVVYDDCRACFAYGCINGDVISNSFDRISRLRKSRRLVVGNIHESKDLLND